MKVNCLWKKIKIWISKWTQYSCCNWMCSNSMLISQGIRNSGKMTRTVTCCCAWRELQARGKPRYWQSLWRGLYRYTLTIIIEYKYHRFQFTKCLNACIQFIRKCVHCCIKKDPVKVFFPVVYINKLVYIKGTASYEFIIVKNYKFHLKKG